jgi:EmrB/QacA subfamily drug resistance transporter
VRDAGTQWRSRASVSRTGAASGAGTPVAIALTLAVFAFSLQQTLVIPALPALQRDLHTTTGWATWVVSGFLLVAAVSTPLAGKLGDQFGKRRALVIALSIFLLGSIAASLAPNIWSLIAARAFQGMGGAVVPLSVAIVRDEAPARRMGMMIGAVFSAAAVGTTCGVVVSGLVVDHLSWRVLFGLGAGIVAIALVLVRLVVPDSPITTHTQRDLAGAALLSFALGSGLLALTEGHGWGWGSARTLGLFAASAVAFALWALVELRVPEPMIDVRMLARRPVLLANTSSFFFGIAGYGTLVLVPRFVETPRGLPQAVAQHVHYGFGVSATTAGLFLMPGFAAGLVSGPLAGLAERRWGGKWPLMAGAVLMASGCGWLALSHGRRWQVVAAMFLVGFAWPPATTGMASVVFSIVRPAETAVAAAMTQVLRQIGGGVGAQVGATILTVDRLAGTSVPAERAYTTLFTIFATTASLAIVLGLLVAPRRRTAPL